MSRYATLGDVVLSLRVLKDSRLSRRLLGELVVLYSRLSFELHARVLFALSRRFFMRGLPVEVLLVSSRSEYVQE